MSGAADSGLGRQQDHITVPLDEGDGVRRQRATSPVTGNVGPSATVTVQASFSQSAWATVTVPLA